ncbi:MAG: Asp-tRNA(Asn)/Glu-tRNA(Gln) amidotransferase subunit GatA [Fimbriimonadaceae bacterium]|nr:Asp-tRNA(Asn)/Glu-tRNA(Gln) amidotransferase subunit GatA [Chthonomonadaceae bacterium]MCO5296145.1 Asp-tRNA(Asn)/Glu-tRNA(Gln) amidotransferase subunit GatA [Fimbriimonadaceae bacterium]
MPTSLTATALRRGLSDRTFSAPEIARACLDRIAELDGEIGAFLTVDREAVEAQARRAQSMLEDGSAGPLTGIPVALKDNLSTAGLRTTCASRMLERYVPPYDATVVDRLKSEGAVILGKTNLDEFAMGTSTENSAFHPTRNPWSRSRSPGGSSGGSAAAVAARLAPLALGSDTGGSVRQPASLCGVVGFKPTYGRCSRYGLVAFASSLDQIGTLARTVEDAALLAEAVTGHDPRDSTSLPMGPVPSADLESGSLRGKRFAVPKEMGDAAVDPDVGAVFESVVETLRAEGAEVDEVSLPSTRYAVTTYYLIAPAEASSNLARFDGVRYGCRAEDGGGGHVAMMERTRGRGFGHEVKARIMIGTYALSAGYYDAYYVRAQQIRARLRDEFQACLERFDFVLSPTSPIPAFPLGVLARDPLALKRLDVFTIPASLGGFPAISLNGGFAGGLPVGVQLVGRLEDDAHVLQTARSIERVLPSATRPAPVP